MENNNIPRVKSEENISLKDVENISLKDVEKVTKIINSLEQNDGEKIIYITIDDDNYYFD